VVIGGTGAGDVCLVLVVAVVGVCIYVIIKNTRVRVD
jgi:hypothetical protein